MVTLLLDSARLEVSLTRVERAISFHPQSLKIPREQIHKVQLTDDPWTWLRGRIPGDVHSRRHRDGNLEGLWCV